MGKKKDSVSLIKSFINSLYGNSDPYNSPLFDNIEETKKGIAKNFKDSTAMNVKIKDRYSNSLSSIGEDDIVKRFTNYGFSNDTLNWMLWMSLYNDSWVFRRAIDKPAQDMVRSGVTLNTSENVDDVYKDLFKLRPQLIELIQWGRLFGGSVAVMLFDNMNDEDYAKPLDIYKISKSKSLKLYITDRWYGCAWSDKTVTDMKNPDFSKPESYDIVFADGRELTVHHDFVLRYEGRTAPRLIKMGQLQGWGYAEGAHILNELARDDQLKASITSLVNKSNIEVVKMAGMRAVFMGNVDEEGEQQLRKRLEMVNWARTYNSLTLLDKDDEYSNFSFSGISGLSELLEKNMWLVSAALEMQGVLFGDLKNGMGADSDALERYDETINNLNENYFRTCLTKLIKVLYIRNGVNDKVEFTFNSLLMQKQNEKKMEGLRNLQQVLTSLLADGVIDTAKYAKILSDYTTKGILNISFDEKEINNLNEKFEEQMENINIEENEEDIAPIKGIIK